MQGATPLQPGRFRDPAYRRPRQLSHSHGTAVLDLAAGGEDIANRIIAAELPQLATAETHGGRLDSYILQAVLQLLDWADTIEPGADNNTTWPQPIVINISYAVSAGAKDGSGFLERELDRLAQMRTAAGAPTHIVLPSGNTFRARGRADFLFPSGGAPAQSQEVLWRVQPDDASPSFLEVHFSGAKGGHMTLGVPGAPPLTVSLNGAPTVWSLTDDGATLASVYLQPGAQSRAIIATEPTQPYTALSDGAYPSGVTRIGFSRIAAQGARPEMRVIAETQRDDTPYGYGTGARQSYLDDEFVNRVDHETGRRDKPDASQSRLTRSGTISAYGTADGPQVMVVGGIRGGPDRSGDVVAAPYSSEGTTDRAPNISEVSEVGRSHQGQVATGLYSGSSTLLDGTSAAAPLVTRKILKSAGGGLPDHKDDILAALIADGGLAFGAQDSRLGRGVAKADAPRKGLARMLHE